MCLERALRNVEGPKDGKGSLHCGLVFYLEDDEFERSLQRLSGPSGIEWCRAGALLLAAQLER
jgi:hypothetical protein